MPETGPAAEVLEAAAIEIAKLTSPERHDYRCPVRAAEADIRCCDCWVLWRSRRAIPTVASTLIAEGRRRAAADIRAVTTRIPDEYPADMRCTPWWNSLSGPCPQAYAEWAARIAEGTP